MPIEIPSSRIRRWTLATIILALLAAATLLAGGAAAQTDTCDRAEDPATDYRCVVSDEFNSLDVAEGTQLDLGTDDVSEPIDIGFEFPWFDATQTQVNVSTKGLVCFTDQDCADYVAQPIPDPEAPNDLAACFWEDLVPTGSITYNRTTTDQGTNVFVVEYRNVKHYGTHNENTFQLQLLETGTVRCQLQDVTHDDEYDDRATAVGIENAAGDHGVRYKFDSFLATNTEILFGQVPEAPADLQATAGPDLAEISLDWTAIEDEVDAYKIYRRPAEGADATLVETVPAGQTSYEDEDLDDDEDYVYSVAATNAFGEGGNSSLADATTFGPPTPPQDSNAAPGSADGEIDLSWDAPAQPNATQWYHVHRNTTSGDGFARVDNVTATDWTDTNVTIGSEYRYNVTAVANDRVGESEPSNLATSYPAGPTAPPTPPQNLQAAPGSSEGELDLAWDAPEQPNGTRWYHVYRNTTSGDGFARVDNVTATDWTDRNVTTGAEYTYNVTAVAYASVGESEPSENAAAVPAGPPGPPASADARDRPQEDPRGPPPAVNVSWTAPSATGGSPVTSYRLERSVDNGTFRFRATVDADARWFNDTAVDCENFYEYRVHAVNEHGDSNPATAQRFTRVGCPSPPQNPSVTQDDGQDALVVEWNAPSNNGGATIQGYDVNRSVDGEAFQQVAQVDDSTTTFPDQNVTCRTHYEYRILARNADGETSANNTTAITTDEVCPDAPASPSTSGNDAEGAVDLSWSAPDDGFADGLDAYHVNRSVDGGDFHHVEEVTPTTTSVTDDDVSCDTSYEYRIVANSSYGSSPNATATFSTDGACPSEAWNASATPDATQQAIALEWNRSNSTGFTADLSEYFIEVSLDGGPLEKVAEVTDGSDTVTHLAEPVACQGQHTFRITPNNTYGSGPGTTASTSVQDVCPSAPQGPATEAGTNAADTPAPDEVNVTWSAPADEGWSSVDRYVIYRCNAGVDDCTAPTNSGWSEVGTEQATAPLYHVDTGLGADTEYAYRVVAENAQGEGDSSTIVTASTPKAPDAPEDVTVSTVADRPLPTSSVTVEWSAPSDTGGVDLLKYHVYRRAVEEDGFGEPVATVDAGTTSYDDTPPGPGDYCYAVTANNTFEGAMGGGETPDEAAQAQDPMSPEPTELTGDCAAFASAVAPPTLSCDGTLGDLPVLCPNAPWNASATADNRTITVDWETPNSTVPGPGETGTNATILAYRVHRALKADGACGAFSHHATVSAELPGETEAPTEYPDTGLDPATTYCYNVTAVRGNEDTAEALPLESETSAVVEATTDGLPSEPTNLDASSSTDGIATLDWDAPAQTNGSQVQQYHVYRDAGCTGSFTEVDAVTATTYTDENNSAGDQAGMPAGDYCYEVTAENGVGEGPADGAQVAVANSAPGAPTGPDAVDSADGEVTVNWTAPSDTGGSGVHHYEIDRRASDGTWEESYETVPGGTLQLVDDELVQGVTFCYEISAFNTAHDDQGNDVAGQESAETTEVCATA